MNSIGIDPILNPLGMSPFGGVPQVPVYDPALAAADPNDLNKWLDSLLRGELSAVETYNQALSTVSEFSGAQTLRAILLDHQDAATRLHNSIVEHGGIPSESSGSWGGGQSS